MRITLYPLDAPIAASPIPVFPDVGSIRSFALPAGLYPSSFTNNLACSLNLFSTFSTSTSGVFPINSITFLYIFDIIFTPLILFSYNSYLFNMLLVYQILKQCQTLLSFAFLLTLSSYF